MKIKMIDQFNQLRDKRRPKESKPKGPVDLKEGRAQVKTWNKGNRKP